MYKNRISVMLSIQSIISKVVKVRMDGAIYWIRVKEAPGWTLYFVHDFPKPNLEESELHNH